MRKLLHTFRVSKGFILPMSIYLTTVALSITVGITVVIVTQLRFSSLQKESALAYYAADVGAMCAKYVDDTYFDAVSGLGIFPSDGVLSATTSVDDTLSSYNSYRLARSLPTLTLSQVYCATVPIFVAASSSMTYAPYTLEVGSVTENGWTSSFKMTMDLGSGATRCASVIVNKTQSFRQIISRGYSDCDSSTRIERAVIQSAQLN